MIGILDRHFEHGGSADKIPAALATVDAETLAALTALCERNAKRKAEIAILATDNKALRRTVDNLSDQVEVLREELATSRAEMNGNMKAIMALLQAQTGPGQATPTSNTDSDPPTREPGRPTRPVAAGEVLANQTLHPLIARAIAQRGNDMQSPPSSDGSAEDEQEDSI